MSVASEITRIQNAKESIRNAIESKGVSVPSNASIDTYSTYIEQISGGSSGIYLYETKYITADASYNTFNDFKNAVVPDLPLDKTFVLIDFVNNTTTSRSGLCWTQTISPEKGIVSSAGARVGGQFGGSYGCNVHAGATINIYVGEFN